MMTYSEWKQETYCNLLDEADAESIARGFVPDYCRHRMEDEEAKFREDNKSVRQRHRERQAREDRCREIWEGMSVREKALSRSLEREISCGSPLNPSLKGNERCGHFTTT
jgi:hypothetical protein